MRTFFILLCLFPFLFIACANSENEEKKSEIKSSEDKKTSIKLEKMQLTDLLDSMKRQPTLYPPFSSINRTNNGDLSAPPTFVYLEDSLWNDITAQLDIPRNNLIGLQPGYKIMNTDNGILFTVNLSYGAGEEKHGYLVALDTMGQLMAKEEIEYSMLGRDGLSALKRYKIQKKGEDYHFTILNMQWKEGKKEVVDSTILAVGTDLTIQPK